jgi:hypothetical protein
MAKKKAKGTRTYHYSVWVSEAQRAMIDAGAKRAGAERPSAWLRKLALEAAT